MVKGDDGYRGFMNHDISWAQNLFYKSPLGEKKKQLEKSGKITPPGAKLLSPSLSSVQIQPLLTPTVNADNSDSKSSITYTCKNAQ